MEEKNIEKKEEVKSETQEIKRPWQGIAWIVGGTILIFGNLMILFFAKSHIGKFIFNLPFLILSILIVIGFYKGWKWIVIFANVLISISLFGGIIGLTKGDFEMIRGLFFVAFLLYCSIACLKHPFYNQKKVEQKS